MSPSVSHEPTPSALLRTASGDRAAEAAIVLLAQSGLLPRLWCCVMVDPDEDLAWIDWSAVALTAERLSDGQRAIVVLAVAVAEQAALALERNADAVSVALSYLLR
ncbi:MAG: hypothetical protein AAGD35_10665 [Actinomycetota bacterium]